MKMWWGAFDLPKNNVLQKQIGPLWIAIKQEKDEWQIYYERLSGWRDDATKIIKRSDTPVTFIPKAENLKERYVLNGSTPKVFLMPALADLAVVARPATPLYVPSGQSVTVYISTPVWVKIGVGLEAVELTDIPTLRPSDSWFGPNTRDGEICYSSRTSARMSESELPKRAHRAITPVKIHNESREHLLLERINLPVPYLELYGTVDQFLWTQGVKMVREENDEADAMEIMGGPPSQIQRATFVAGPREKPKGKTIIRRISGFFA